MNKHILTYLLFFVFLLFNTIKELKAQTSVCSGTLQANTLSTYPTTTTIGNGTPGNIKVCITANNLVGSGGMCGTGQLVVSTTSGTYVAGVVWNSGTANGTCYTFTTGTGYAYLAQNCFGASANATITWETVDGSGNNICPSCSDGIQNQGETGVDCGGPCAACSGDPCSDGILNNGETSIDCGGPNCAPCPTCFDGLQNQGETGVDCGGPCMSCSTNSTPTNSSCGTCPASASVTIYPSVCDQVGTSAYNLNSPIVNMVSCGTSTTPSPAPTCATVGSEGTWLHADLAPGVTQVQFAFNGGTAANGSSSSWIAAYQGNNCGTLTPVTGGCQQSVEFTTIPGFGSVQIVYQNFFNGLDPSQDLWVFIFNDAGKAFNLNYSLVGTAGPPSNTSCASSATAIGDACNLGAPGASFTPPGACTGGSWGSNENTTFYAFTADSTAGTLEIGNITCNDGSAGNGQFGVWTSCAAIGTTGLDFLGCAVGNGTINLTNLVDGQTYYIAADGFAGDNCAWDFTGVGIVLPVKLNNFSAIYNKNKVDLNWITETEKNNDYFTIERSKDLINFEVIEIVKGKGNSTSRNIYGVYDLKPYSGISYYRLKQTDYDGNFEYFDPVSVSVYPNIEDINIYPNPTSENSFIEFTSSFDGILEVLIYDISGRIVFNNSFSMIRGLNVLQLETSSFSQGMYYVNLSNNEENINLKLIKE